MLHAVIQAGETYENPRSGTRVEVRESTPDRIVFDRRYPPNTGRADPHVHFDITQSWEVLSGEARDIHNPQESELTVRWTVEPVNDFPIPLQKLVIPAGAWLGRLRGYRPRYDET
jgi:hypothetical protein